MRVRGQAGDLGELSRSFGTLHALTQPFQYVHESYTRVPLHNKSIMPTVAVGLLLSTVSVTSEGWATLVTKLQMQFLWATHQVRNHSPVPCTALTYLPHSSSSFPSS